MKQKKYMEINNTNDVIKFFNICINNVCKYNFLCLKALNQEKKEIELDLSETTRAWLSSRHKAYATCRLETINNNFSEMKRLKEIIVQPKLSRMFLATWFLIAMIIWTKSTIIL